MDKNTKLKIFGYLRNGLRPSEIGRLAGCSHTHVIRLRETYEYKEWLKTPIEAIEDALIVQNKVEVLDSIKNMTKPEEIRVAAIEIARQALEETPDGQFMKSQAALNLSKAYREFVEAEKAAVLIQIFRNRNNV